MRHISYTNTSGSALDCRVLRLAGISDTSGTVIKEYLNVADEESFIYTPSLSGLYSVATKAEGVATDYVIDEAFVPVYITAIRNNSAFPIISGYSLKEFSDYFKLKLHLTDNMNSGVQFQNFTFEILYSYVDGEGDDYNAAVPEFTSALSPIIHGAKEHSSGGRYSYPVMMIRESEYTTDHNKIAASDFYSYQHKAMFIGDTIMIPKINGQAEVGRYLIFSIRRRPLNRSITETSVISQCFSAPVTIETSYNKIAALQTAIAPETPTIIDLFKDDRDYVIEDGKNSIVVLIDNNDVNPYRIVLPVAIVGLRVTIINQDNADVDILPASGEYINGSVNSTPVTKLTSATFYCYYRGNWAII
jgi:hypothetical protein